MTYRVSASEDLSKMILAPPFVMMTVAANLGLGTIELGELIVSAINQVRTHPVKSAKITAKAMGSFMFFMALAYISPDYRASLEKGLGIIIKTEVIKYKDDFMKADAFEKGVMIGNLLVNVLFLAEFT